MSCAAARARRRSSRTSSPEALEVRVLPLPSMSYLLHGTSFVPRSYPTLATFKPLDTLVELVEGALQPPDELVILGAVVIEFFRHFVDAVRGLVQWRSLDRGASG